MASGRQTMATLRCMYSLDGGPGICDSPPNRRSPYAVLTAEFEVPGAASVARSVTPSGPSTSRISINSVSQRHLQAKFQNPFFRQVVVGSGAGGVTSQQDKYPFLPIWQTGHIAPGNQRFTPDYVDN